MHALKKHVSNFVVIRHQEDRFATRDVFNAFCVHSNTTARSLSSYVALFVSASTKEILSSPFGHRAIVVVVVIVVCHFQTRQDSFATR